VYGEQRCVVNRLGVVTVRVYADYVFNSRNVQLNTIKGIYLYLYCCSAKYVSLRSRAKPEWFRVMSECIETHSCYISYH
jgi:hypothetical protein